MRKVQKIEVLKIDKIAAEGNGIAKTEQGIYFVEKAIPGDVVEAKIIKKKKDYGIAKIQKILEPAKERIDAVCAHFGTCGGCYWQSVNYSTQAEFKQQIMLETFWKIAKIKIQNPLPILAAQQIFEYRNKMEYTFSNRAWLTDEQIQSDEVFEKRALGFHVAGSFASILQIDKCYLQNDFANKIRNHIYQFCLDNNFEFYNLKLQEGFARNLIIRNTTLDEWMVTVCVAQSNQTQIDLMMQNIQTSFPQITSLNYVINTKKNDSIYDQEVINFAGRPYIIEVLDGIKYKISTKSFFQTNSFQAKLLYDVTVKFAKIEPNDIVYDLYCGTGSIALYIAKYCKQVVGIEQIDDAIIDARENAQINQISNAKFFTGTVEKLLDEAFIRENKMPDIVILDPPRAGLHNQVVETLLIAKPKRIVYVSCNPATQARDVQLLSAQYNLLESQAVDMFPHTYHIENVVLLELKEEA